MENTSKTEPLSKRDLYYYRRRFLNRVFSELAKYFSDEAEKNGATKSKIAKRLDVDPSQITRWFSGPSNLTLESISDILLALDAEAEPFKIVPFRERTNPNYAHPVIAQVLSLPQKNRLHSVISTGDEATLKTLGLDKLDVRTDSAVAAE